MQIGQVHRALHEDRCQGGFVKSPQKRCLQVKCPPAVRIAEEVQSASREMDVFEMDVTEQVEGVEAWQGGQLNTSSHAISVAAMPQWTLEHCVFAYDSFVKKW